MDQQNNQSPQGQTPKQQVVEALKNATNVLVTVSNNPSVDQLAACIGLTLMLNKLDKHATAVFSGKVPSTLEFLQPEKTIEANTDSLRDFIISLDRSKADKLRYKVEDDVVKIFITPYRTSISGADLQFSQGDFNVDVVMALGVDERDHLDEAITSHGRILHDATVIGLSCGSAVSDVGAISWHEDSASSLSEMLVSISEAFQNGLLDGQMATSFLTGIVAETERFSNEKTTPKVMTMSAQLMAAGANQQLISSQLAPAPAWQPPTEEPAKAPVSEPEPEKPIEPYQPPKDENETPPPSEPEPKPKEEFDIPKEGEPVEDTSGDMISLHEPTKNVEEKPAEVEPVEDIPGPAVDVEYEPEAEKIEEIHIDENGKVHDASSDAYDAAKQATQKLVQREARERVIQPLPGQQKEIQEPKTNLNSYIFEPPANGGTFTGSTEDDAVKEDDESATGEPQTDIPMLSHEHNILEGSNDDEAASPTLPPVPEEGPSNTPSLANSVNPSIINGSDSSESVDPLAGMSLPVVNDSSPDQVTPPPSIPPAQPETVANAVEDAEAARQAVLNAIGSSSPLSQSPIAALNASPISLDATVPVLSDPDNPPPPPVPPPMMIPPIGPGESNLPSPVDENEQQPTNPFNLPPVH